MGDFYSNGKRKSKPRNSSSSSESESPLHKRPLETVNVESRDEQRAVFEKEPRGEDQVSVTLDMALDVTTRFGQILVKLAKLDAIEATLNDFRQKMIRVECEVNQTKGRRGRGEDRSDWIRWILACSGLIPKLKTFKVRLRI